MAADKVQLRLGNLNNSAIRLLTKAVEENATTDLMPVLEKLMRTYASARDNIAEGDLKKHRKATGESTEPKPTPPTHVGLTEHVIPHASNPATVISPLSPSVLALLVDSGAAVSAEKMPCFPNLPQVLGDGKVLWESQSRVVMQLEGEIVVKIGHDLDHAESALLTFVAHQAPDIPIPKPLGSIVIQSITYMFMTSIPGVTLEECWPRLLMDQKMSIRFQLNRMMLALRRVPYVTGDPLGSISTPHLCIDNRMRKRHSPHPLFTESDFNDFLVSRPFQLVSAGFTRWIRSLLRNDHHIVLTHGDFHPRNIMVVENEHHVVAVSGIIDWEMGGWYPEHWEWVKAQNTRGVEDNSDWWDFLPQSISGYDTEVVVDRFLETFINVF